MLGRERALELLEEAIRYAQADSAEIVVEAQERQVTRFAGSAIHQNMAENNVRATIRVVLGQRIGYASTNRLAEGGLTAAVDQAVRLARLQAPDPEFVSLPSPAPIPQLATFFPATAASTPAQRAEVVGQAVGMLAQAGCEASGVFSAETTELAVGNSLGIRAYAPMTAAQFLLVASDGDASGYAEWLGRDISALQAEAVVERARRKCVQSRNPISLEPGCYPVILEPPAVADMLQTLAWVGLSATALQEHRSFMDGRVGEQVADERVSLWDDGSDPRTMAMPFDFEGVPKQKVMLIEHGVARGVVYDSYTAHKEHRLSTGHALPPPNVWGPYPLNLIMAPGDTPLSQMIAGTDRGILITTFHYTNTLKPKETSFTGMTRHGTFLVEHGRVARPIRNLRFTDAILPALNRLQAVGDQQELVGGVLCPALALSAFNFTS